MSKKYRLIKEYPNSPKLGSVIIDTNPNNGAKDCWFSEDWGKSGSKAFFIQKSTNPDKHPEFWEEIKEKEWEILDYKGLPGSAYFYIKLIVSPPKAINTHEVQWGINSIKRLTDNTIFSLGDKIKCLNSHVDKPEVINKIELNKEGTPCLFTNSFHNNGVNIFKAVKYEKIFTTEDGVGVFEDDIVHWVRLCGEFKYLYPLRFIEKHLVLDFINEYRVFSTEKAAKEYIEMNKPKYSKKDIILALQKHGNINVNYIVYGL